MRGKVHTGDDLRRHKATEGNIELIEYLKERGEVYLTDIQNHFGIDYHNAIRMVDNATTAQGSRIYQETENNRLIIGWLT
jgi:phosphoribosylaminoimidazole-succinocarboxamide synthase